MFIALPCPVCLQVEPQHVHYELSAAKFSWDHPRVYASASRLTSVTVVKDPYEACADAHAICVLTGVCALCQQRQQTRCACTVWLKAALLTDCGQKAV